MALHAAESVARALVASTCRYWEWSATDVALMSEHLKLSFPGQMTVSIEWHGQVAKPIEREPDRRESERMSGDAMAERCEAQIALCSSAATGSNSLLRKAVLQVP